MITSNCNIKHDKEFDVYCGRGRGSLWNPLSCIPGKDKGWLGNPIVVNVVCPVCGCIHESKGSTLVCYEIYLKERLNKDLLFREEFYKLKGKKLGCYCVPNPCHTSIIIRIIDGEKKEFRLF